MSSLFFACLSCWLLVVSGVGAPLALDAAEDQSSLWFDLGHRIVVDIAMLRMKPHTIAAARDLLGGESLQDVSVWADRIRGQRRNTSPLHYVNIPITAQSYVPARDCPRGQCIIAAIDSFALILGDSAEPR